MADITLNRKHNYGADAKAKVAELVASAESKLAGQIDKIEWNDDKSGATASGKMFKAHFHVTETDLNVEVDLLSMMAKMAKGVVKEKLEKIVGEKFPA